MYEGESGDMFRRLTTVEAECLNCGLKGLVEVDEAGQFFAGLFEYGECPNCGSYDVEET